MRNATVPEPYAELVYVTPALAEEWLKLNVGNRAEKEQKTDVYARDMATDDWLVTGDGPKFDIHGRLINAQHTLRAVIKSGKTVPMFVFRGLPPDAQKVMDTGVKRSAADALKMEGVTGCRLTTLAATARIAMAWDAGLSQETTQGRNTPDVSNSEVLAWVYDNPDAIDSCAQSSLMGALLPPPSVLAFTHLTLSRIDDDDCSEFFASLVNVRSRGTGDPIAALMKRWNGAIIRREKVSQHQHLYLIFRTWNAFRAGDDLNHLKTGRSGTTPIAIPEPK